MADEDEDMPMQSDDESSNSESGSGEEQTEWLATTRKKRSTAGNRLSTLIQQAAAEDDELELLFAEDENDAVFEDIDTDASDAQMDSSDDDEDQSPEGGAEELEGEKELQRQERAERQAKKRKANDVIPNVFRKRVKIDPTAPNAPRPKKKSERMSWIPTAEEAPTRASARRTTKLSKEQLHAQMLDRERRRLRQLEVMEKAAKKKDAAKPKTMTQEERLAEAVRVESRNAKSLNHWEEAEKLREEEQKAKLAALHSRKLEGPVITWWSGVAEWVGGKLKRVGKAVIEEKEKGGKEKKEPGRKRKADVMEDTRASLSVATHPIQTTIPGTFRSPYPPTTPAVTITSESVSESSTNQNTPSAAPPSRPTDSPAQIPVSIPGLTTMGASSASTPAGADGENMLPLLPGGGQKETASSIVPPGQNGAANPLATVVDTATATGASQPVNLAVPEIGNGNGNLLPTPTGPPTVDTVAGPSTTPPNTQSNQPPVLGLGPRTSATNESIPDGASPATPANGSQLNPIGKLSSAPSLPPPPPPPRFDGSVPLPGFYNPSPNPRMMPSQTIPFAFAPVPAQELPPVVEHGTRNCLILENFNELSVKSKDIQCQILFGRKFQKTPKPPSSIPCAITAYPAKFRDPSTGLYYYNAYAYKELQRLKRGDYRWSTLLQAYVGQSQYAARGVPLRFIQK